MNGAKTDFLGAAYRRRVIAPMLPVSILNSPIALCFGTSPALRCAPRELPCSI